MQVPAELRQQSLVAVLQAIIDGHDTLRMWLQGCREKDWNLRIAPPGAIKADECLRRVDLAGLEGEARQERMQAAVQEAAGRLNPSAGRMLEAVWFVGTDAARLALVIHHLAVDGVSWRILISDLAAAWSSVVRGERAEIEPVGTPFRVWTQHLAKVARTPALLAQLSAWEAILADSATLVPSAGLEPMDHRPSSAGLLADSIAGQFNLSVAAGRTGGFPRPN